MCFHIRMQYYLLIYRDLIMNLSFWALSISKALYTYGTIIIICSLSMMFPVIKPRRFFFSSRRRHTSSNCDWSSDVCSSDLDDALDARPPRGGEAHRAGLAARVEHRSRQDVRAELCASRADRDHLRVRGRVAVERHAVRAFAEIGRASCRERV